MLANIREDVTQTIGRVQFRMDSDPMPQFDLPVLPDFITTHIDPFTGEDDSADRDAASSGFITSTLSRPTFGGTAMGDDPYADQNISRNAQCPCGSGLKYKHCHGQLA